MRIFIALFILCFTSSSFSNVNLRFNTAKENPAYIHWNDYQTAYVEFAPPWENNRTLIGMGYTKPISPKQTVSVSLFSDYMDTIIVDTVYNPLGEIQWTSLNALYRNYKEIQTAYTYAPFDKLSLGAALNIYNVKYRDNSPFISESMQEYSKLLMNIGASYKINNHSMATNYISFAFNRLINYNLKEKGLNDFTPLIRLQYRGEYFKEHFFIDLTFDFNSYYFYILDESNKQRELDLRLLLSVEGRIANRFSLYGTIGYNTLGFGAGSTFPYKKKEKMISFSYEAQKNFGSSDIRWRHLFTTSLEFGKNRNNQ